MTREEAISELELFKKSALVWNEMHLSEAIDMAIEALSAEAVQGDAISKRFISDAILQKISELNAQGEKAIPIAREFIRFKRFVDGLTPTRTEAVQGEWVRKYDDKVNCYWYECDQCGEYRPRNQFGHEYNANFCPNCGAKMTKGGDDE